MKEIWPYLRVGCLQYLVQVEKKNEELWKYLKKDIFNYQMFHIYRSPVL